MGRFGEYYLMRGIWHERNAQTFKGCEKSVFDLKLLFLRTLLEWINASGLFSFDTLVEMLAGSAFTA